MGIGIWGIMVLVYRLKIVFALDGYLIGCGDSGLVSSQHNLAFFFTTLAYTIIIYFHAKDEIHSIHAKLCTAFIWLLLSLCGCWITKN